ncbi:MAG: hypothetical protein ACD_3C00154G0012 [uncultured bacterium (gcode 4)]|uniref:Uncharacterized protein n=1 Tax=uncultured bacterium (gcode 4) TaxID=1234023 RepID=K2GC28_9BACT|nr:MAG: hypothetical protein ACD_3C00154G0012 [uncultured bacterium (gcode 4)]
MPLSNAGLEHMNSWSEENKVWMIYIYELIEKDFEKYCDILKTDPRDIDKAKYELYLKITHIIKVLKSDYIRYGWLEACIMKIWEEGISPQYKLWWAELHSMANQEERIKIAEKELIYSRRIDIKRAIARLIMWSEAKILMDEAELTDYISKRNWPHLSVLTQTWKDIINWYQEAVWWSDLDRLKKQVRELSNWIF